ncbi:hypothetical protein MJN54_30185, partial [Salmonella enterica subsp. enterica serovar Kentucky]|nr:hypothetical protein [Salmonella enterica subsp. enterica serovar Kentucky]
TVRERAEDEAINVFARNLHDLLMAAPAGLRATMGLDPGLRTGLKFKVPGGVVTTIAGLIFLVFIIALIGYHPDTRISLYVGFAW